MHSAPADRRPGALVAPSGRSIAIEAVSGLGQLGAHHLLVRIGGAQVAIDAGARFPSGLDVGIERYHPDAAPLRAAWQAGTLRGLLLTHGHLDHVGSVPYLLRAIPGLPVYGERWALAFLRRQFERRSPGERPDLRLVTAGTPVDLGSGLTATWRRVTHSLPGAASIVLRGDAGTVVHSGDFRVQRRPLMGPPCDVEGLEAEGRAGVDVALVDSTGAGRAGRTVEEEVLRGRFARLFEATPGRVLVTTFASHLERVVAVAQAAASVGRKAAVLGAGFEHVVQTARELGELPDGLLVSQEEALDGPPGGVVLLITGSQGEPRAPLARAARGEDRRLRIGPGDLVLWSARVIPGNERAVGGVANRLAELGAAVLPPWSEARDLHTSGHGHAEEIAEWVRWVRPARVVPIHGEALHLRAQHDALERLGQPVTPLRSGERLSIEGDATRVERARSGAGTAEVGSMVWSAAEPAIRQRRQAAETGVITVALGAPPRIVSAGVFPEDEAQARERSLEQVAAEHLPGGPEAVRLAVRAAARSWTGQTPLCVVRAAHLVEDADTGVTGASRT